MEQHPIPQNISSYQFRLIGDMTLRQFFLLLGGGGVAALFYYTNLPGIIKWFFIFICVLSGVAFAFLPLEGRPLDQWLMAFIKTIYNPTRFYWKKTPTTPDYLSDKIINKTPIPTAEVIVKTPPSPNLPDSYAAGPEVKIDDKEQSDLDRINNLFSQTITPTTTPPSTVEVVNARQPTDQTSQKTEVMDIQPIKINPTPETTTVQLDTIQPVEVLAPQPEPATQIPTNTPPMTQPNAQAANFNPDLPFPDLPETANTLVGMVFDRSGKIVENAIVEIKNDQGTVRATKTNRLGQFFLATPLKSESYVIEIEKPGLSFTPISIKLEDKIYPPLEIHSLN